jgi:hypothetical protein
MKLFKCTIVADNSCYVETKIVTAKDEKSADKEICKKAKRKVKYTQPLQEVKIDLLKSKVYDYIGWGRNESLSDFDD